MPTPHQDFIATQPAANRVVVFQEDFEATTGSLPAAIPSSWTTDLVSTASAGLTPAFKIFDATLANANGYWPVPETGNGNLFAAANDDPDPCDCDMMDAWMQTPLLDFTGLFNVGLYFDIFHDQNFGAGDAKIWISMDGGVNFTEQPIIPGDTLVALPVDEAFWQNIVIPMYEYDGMDSVVIRFQWSDDGGWVSGFAVDNVVVQEMDYYDAVNMKTVLGDWSIPTISAGLWDYTRVPLTQTSPLSFSTVVINGGIFDMVAPIVDCMVNQNGVDYGPFTASSANTTAMLVKDTLTVVSDFTPSVLGTLSFTSTVDLGIDETNVLNNVKSGSLEITTYNYARDNGTCALFYGNDVNYEFGNLFEINTNDDFGAIETAIRFDPAVVGTVVKGKIYEYQGIDAAGLPILVDLGIETIDYEIVAGDNNVAGESTFITLPFLNGPASLESGKTYLVVCLSSADTDVAVSGFNAWPVSWFHDGVSWGYTLGIPMVRLNSDESLSVKNRDTVPFSVSAAYPQPSTSETHVQVTLNQNATVSYVLTNAMGQVVAQERMGKWNSGSHVLTVPTHALAHGVYTLQIKLNDQAFTQQISK